MYNYHTNVVWTIDIVLMAALVSISMAIIAYIMMKDYIANKRNRALLSIKKDVYELVLSGKPVSDKTCPAFIDATTLQQFLDVTTNRNREAIFFNESEQKAFRECFLSPEKISEMEKTAKKSRNKWKRIEAIAGLGYAGVSEAADIIRGSLYDKDEDVSYFSLLALGQIKTASSAKALIDFFKKNVHGRYKIASILESFPPSVVGEVAVLIDDPSPVIRAWGLKILSGFNPEGYIKKIESLTEDKHEEVRAAACECLGELKPDDVRSILVGCLKDDSWMVRSSGVRALSNAFGAPCIPDIMPLIKDNSLSVIDSVKTALAEHIETALPYIEKIFEEDDELAKKVSVEALGSGGYITEVFKNIVSGDSKKRAHATKFLQSMIRAHAHFGVEASLKHFDKDDRKKIFEVIESTDKAFAEHIDNKAKKKADQP